MQIPILFLATLAFVGGPLLLLLVTEFWEFSDWSLVPSLLLLERVPRQMQFCCTDRDLIHKCHCWSLHQIWLLLIVQFQEKIQKIQQKSGEKMQFRRTDRYLIHKCHYWSLEIIESFLLINILPRSNFAFHSVHIAHSVKKDKCTDSDFQSILSISPKYDEWVGADLQW